MRILVRSRCLMSELDLAERYVVVSITDPPPFGGLAEIPQRRGLEDILRLEFFDLDPEDYRETGEEDSMISKAMKPEHGEKLAKFLWRHRKIPVVVIACEAGASRSPSMAFAIADQLKLPRSIINWAGRDTQVPPINGHVYGVTRCAMTSLLNQMGKATR